MEEKFFFFWYFLAFTCNWTALKCIENAFYPMFFALGRKSVQFLNDFKFCKHEFYQSTIRFLSFSLSPIFSCNDSMIHPFSFTLIELFFNVVYIQMRINVRNEIIEFSMVNKSMRKVFSNGQSIEVKKNDMNYLPSEYSNNRK